MCMSCPCHVHDTIGVSFMQSQVKCIGDLVHGVVLCGVVLEVSGDALCYCRGVCSRVAAVC